MFPLTYDALVNGLFSFFASFTGSIFFFAFFNKIDEKGICSAAFVLYIKVNVQTIWCKVTSYQKCYTYFIILSGAFKSGCGLFCCYHVVLLTVSHSAGYEFVFLFQLKPDIVSIKK